ncbi:MAG TPA: dihydrofolate reductase family protein [Chitinophagaceae bacterium]|nr:dihydrofolate reductase family protein [Chitinophagaceae bacterium]
MRKVIVSNMISVDGFFEAPDQSLDWFAPGDDFFDYSAVMLDEMDTILFGHTTYKQMEAFWTSPAADILPAIKERMNRLQKVVFSHTLETAAWNNSTIAKGNIVVEINKLKQQQGKNVVILGSGEIVSALTHLKLVDEFRIIVSPIILGDGTPLFRGIHNRINLNLQQTKTLSNGTIILYYAPTAE